MLAQMTKDKANTSKSSSSPIFIFLAHFIWIYLMFDILSLLSKCYLGLVTVWYADAKRKAEKQDISETQFLFHLDLRQNKNKASRNGEYEGPKTVWVFSTDAEWGHLGGQEAPCILKTWKALDHKSKFPGADFWIQASIPECLALDINLDATRIAWLGIHK